MALDIGTLVGYIEMDDSKGSEVIDKFPDKIKGMGAKGVLLAAAGAVAIGAALGQGITNAVDLDQANHKLAAQLGLTADESAKAGKIAGELYSQNYGDSMDDVSTAVGAVMSSISGMRTASSKDIQGVTADVLNMSKAFEIDTARAAQIVGQTLKTGLAPDAQTAADLVTAALQKVPANVREDLLDAVDEYSPFFQQIGIKGDEAFSLLVKASEKGMYGIDKTGDALKEFTIRSTDMSKTTSAAYESMGMDSQTMANRILAGGDSAKSAFTDIVKGIQGIQDPATRSNTAIALFGTQMEDLGVGEVPKFLDSLLNMGGALGDTKGKADEMGAALNGGTANSLASLQRNFEGIMTGVGQTLLPFLNGILEWAMANPGIMQIVAAALGVLALAFIGVSIATWAMNTALLANPITWIILAIVALIAALVLLVLNWDTVVKWISDVWGGFIGWFTGVMDGFFGWWNGVWAGFASWITDVWNGFIGFIVDVWNGFIGWIMDGINAYYSFWVGVWTAIGSFIIDTWNGFTGFVRDVFNNFMLGLKIIGAVISAWWNGLWSGVGSFIATIWNNIVSAVVGTFTSLYNNIMGIGRNITSFVNSVWSGIVSFAQDAWNGLISWMKSIPGWIKGVFDGAVGWLRDIGSNIINGLMNGLKAGWDRIIGWINGLGGGIIDTFKNILGIHSPSRVFFGFGENIGEGLINGLDKLQPEIDQQINGMVTVPPTPDSAMIGANGQTVHNETKKEFTYVAAPNSSLSTEEELFDALSRPRSDF